MEKEDDLNNPDINRVDPSEDIGGGGISRSESGSDEEETEDAGDNMQ